MGFHEISFIEVSGMDGDSRLTLNSPVIIMFQYLEMIAAVFSNSSHGERELGSCTLLQSKI